MRRQIGAKITGVATYLPPRRVTNDDLEKILGVTDEWIRTRTGILERRYAAPGVACSHLASAAALRLLQEKEVSPDEIDLIIVATVTPDMQFPATACLVQHSIGAKKAWGFDLIAACSGLLYGLSAAAQFVIGGLHRKVMVIGADVMTSILDFQDRSTCPLFGDGAGAVLVEPAEPDEDGILDFVGRIDGAGGACLRLPAGGSLLPASHETVSGRLHYVKQRGSQVFKHAVEGMYEAFEQLRERNGFHVNDLDLVVPHQANVRILQVLQKRLGLDDSRIMVNLERCGNTAAATIALALQEALDTKRLKKGDLVMLLAVGAGFSGGGMLLRWAY